VKTTKHKCANTAKVTVAAKRCPPHRSKIHHSFIIRSSFNILIMGIPVFLIGDAGEVGRLQGELQSVFLRERVARVLARAENSQATSLLQARAEKFAGVLQAVCPHWLDEAEAIAQAAQIEKWQLLAFNCLPENFWGENSRFYAPAPLVEKDISQAKRDTKGEELVNPIEAQSLDLAAGGGDCTTFFALGGASLSSETLFHKSRDECDEVQVTYIKQCDNRYRYIGSAEVGNLGTAHLHTEHFWAGANNTGSPVANEEYEDCALSDAHVLRYLGENCVGLDDIVPALENLISQNHLGGGAPNAGMILLFADESRGLVVEATSRRLHAEFFEGDAMVVRTNHFLFPSMQEYSRPAHAGSVARYERAVELWEEQDGFASIPGCSEISRDRENAPLAICRNPSDGLKSVTVSTSTAIISSHDDRRCQTHFRNCHPDYTPAIILTPLDRVCDSDLASGAHNQQWRNYRGWV
jgi:hypothetical protein